MSNQQQQAQPPGMTLGDIYFILFRRKWIILSFAVAGIIAAATLYISTPAQFQSETELFIRYVVEGKTLNLPGGDDNAKTLGDQEQSVINTEVEILKSFDLARQVAETIGPARILAKAGGGADTNNAACLVMKSLTVDQPAKGSMLSITFRHPDSELPQVVLSDLITLYYKKHAAAHVPLELLGDAPTKEAQRQREELTQTETDLRALMNEAGIDSLQGARSAYTEQIAKINESLTEARADLAEHEAALGQVPKLATDDTTNAAPVVPREMLVQYRNLSSRLEALMRQKEDLLQQFKEGSSLVVEKQQNIDDVKDLLNKLVVVCPALTNLNAAPYHVASGSATAALDPAVEAAQARALHSKIDFLNAHLAELKAQSAKLDQLEPRILDLQRRKDRQEQTLGYFVSSVEKAHIEQQLGTGKAPNIGIIEPPTPPSKARPKSFKKRVLMLAAGGLAAGFGLAFLLELYIDGTVKRPSEVKAKLKLPLSIAIPRVSRNGRHSPDATRPNGSETETSGAHAETPSGSLALARSEQEDPLTRFYQGLRDRLIINFEARNLAQKPKLVAVTSCDRGAGVSTIAAGLAASLSATGDGNVLLVQMNSEQGASRQFYKGKPGCALDVALSSETMGSAKVESNLYVATEQTESERLPQLLPRKFASLVPKLKASDYDYIIFDMPPVSQTSMTPRAARIMDMVLLVLESEKTSQEVVKHATTLLAESKVTVSTVLNKTRNYVPTWLHREFMNEP